MSKKNKNRNEEKLVLIRRSRPRPEIGSRPVVFASRKQYKRSRDKKVPAEY